MTAMSCDALVAHLWAGNIENEDESSPATAPYSALMSSGKQKHESDLAIDIYPRLLIIYIIH